MQDQGGSITSFRKKSPPIIRYTNTLSPTRMPLQMSDLASEAGSSYAGSSTSTLEFDQEPFETFRHRVQALASSIWQSSTPGNTIIERMEGGSYNRVIGLARILGNGTRKDYVLRTPRISDVNAEDVAALQFVNNVGNIAVPDIVAFNTTTDNALGHPYILHTRLSGDLLIVNYPILSYQDKIRVAKELGEVYRKMTAVTGNTPGTFSMSEYSASPTRKTTRKTEKVVLRPLVLKALFQDESVPADNNTDYKDAGNPGETPSPCSIFELLSATFKRRIALVKKDMEIQKARNGKGSLGYRIEYFEKCLEIATMLETDGWFEDNAMCLCHFDFAARNIQVDPDSKHAILAAVLDWDMSGIAPTFMACAPPQYLWDWHDEEDEDERTADNIPETEENRTLKLTFEEAAGATYIRYAYAPEYRLARRLFRFALDAPATGLWFYGVGQGGDELLKEWAEMKGARKNKAA